MGNRAVSLAVLIPALIAGACASGQRAGDIAPLTGTRVIGYYFGPTANRGFTPADIRGNLLTHINYAFGEVRSDGTAALANPALDAANFAALKELKQRYPHLKLLISFGGWGGSKYFSDVALSRESRTRFIESVLANFLDAYPGLFDGVDLDWEYPTGGGAEGNIKRAEDRENFTALVRELRARLDETNRGGHLITIATPAGASLLDKYELPQLAALLDFINVMTYDYHTGGGIANYNAPLAAASNDPTPEYNIASTVAAYLAAGVPRDKLVIGVPFYGYSYPAVAAANNGLFQPSTGEAKALRFTAIAGLRANGYRRYWDEAARVPYLYNSETRTWVTYDDAESIAAKADYVRDNDLGGIMIWELSGDDGTLLPAIARHLTR